MTMNLSRQYCFTSPQGEDIYLYKLSNNKGTEVTISNYGAIITSYIIRMPDGQANDIVLGFDNIKDYQGKFYLSQYPWFGAAIGRYGNRIKNARFQIGGKEYLLTKNAGDNQLHGGVTGFDKKIWREIDASNGILVLTYTSSDGEEGYPGTLEVQLSYMLNDVDELCYEYIASTNKPTAVNLTHHSYFNLENGQGDIRDHTLKITASHYLEQDESLATTGRLIAVENTMYDFLQPKKISADWDQKTGYDQSFVTDKPGKTFGKVAEAWSGNSKLKLEVWTTEPVVHFYSGVWIPRVNGKNGTTYGPYSGFCLETQIHPNAVNYPHFPNTILRPGETYYQKTVYKVLAGSVK